MANSSTTTFADSGLTNPTSLIGFTIEITGGSYPGETATVTGYASGTFSVTPAFAHDPGSVSFVLSPTPMVTHTDYDPAGNVLDTVDPRGIETKYASDMLRRTTSQVVDYTDGTPTADTNQTTDYTYDGNNDILAMKAVLPSSAYQTTAYVYGIGGTAGTNLFSNDIVSKIEYPNASTGAASSTSTDDQVFTYDWQGEKTTFTDQNQTIHTYGYDVLGRETLDSIAVASGNPANIDTSIKALGYSYTTGGRLLQATSYSSTTICSGTEVNYVLYAYNGFGQETSEKQFHGGGGYSDSNNTVQYNYDSIANGSRLTSMTYPNGRVEDYIYNTGIDSAISRVSAIADDYNYTDACGPALPVQSYTYLGLDTIVNKLDGNGVELTYTGQSSESSTNNADGGDQYTGLDRFGRVIDQNWYNTSTSSSNERFQYGYDQDGNVLYKDNLVAPTFSELYHANSSASGDNASAYDALGRLTGFRRGTLSVSGSHYNGTAGLDTVATGDLNSIASDNTITYSLDALGNQASVNSKNELTATHVGYDHDGNMVEDGSENTFTYDAWNRLVGGSQLGSHVYSYDALGRRTAFAFDNIENRDDFYYSADGHNIEDHFCNGITDQYVWGLGGPNELVLRDENATSNIGEGESLGKSGSNLGQRIYVEQDANENVTALVGPTGTMLQHFVYDPYGAVQVINAGYTATTSDSYNWSYLFQGGRRDPNTGLYRFGVRDLRTDGTWQEAEPLGGAYIDGLNLYQSFLSNPLKYVDPSGFDNASSTQASVSEASLGAKLGDGDFDERNAATKDLATRMFRDPTLYNRIKKNADLVSDPEISKRIEIAHNHAINEAAGYALLDAMNAFVTIAGATDDPAISDFAMSMAFYSLIASGACFQLSNWPGDNGGEDQMFIP